MKTEIKIIKFLLPCRKTCTIREISKHINSYYKITHTAVQRLIKKGIIESRKAGQSAQISLTGRLAKEVYEAEGERRNELLKKSVFRSLYAKLAGIKPPFIALIFGSYAKGTADRKSDIDLMIIADEKKQRELESKISLLPFNIHTVSLTYDEFAQMAKSREFSVVSEALKCNVILAGIEDYYGMVKDGYKNI